MSIEILNKIINESSYTIIKNLSGKDILIKEETNKEYLFLFMDSENLDHFLDILNKDIKSVIKATNIENMLYKLQLAIEKDSPNFRLTSYKNEIRKSFGYSTIEKNVNSLRYKMEPLSKKEILLEGFYVLGSLSLILAWTVFLTLFALDINFPIPIVVMVGLFPIVLFIYYKTHTGAVLMIGILFSVILGLLACFTNYIYSLF